MRLAVPMSPTDSVFLAVESRSQPMHVGGLELFRPASGADLADVRAMFAAMQDPQPVAPLFRRTAVRSLPTAGQWSWAEDEGFDLAHHVRHNSLPGPGRVLELLALCSRLHSTMLDRRRPLWEAHLIEGLADGRFAIYFKVHHALMDGLAAQRVLRKALSFDPSARDMPAPWAYQRLSTVGSATDPLAGVSSRDSRVGTSIGSALRAGGSPANLPVAALRSALELAAEAAGLPRALGASVRRAVQGESGPLSFQAPRTILNVPITGARRFAAQSWPLARFRALRKGTDVTVNDVVLAMCSGALRRYLLDLNALPDDSLIALVPVALNSRATRGDGGNSIGGLMCNLGTDLDDPLERLMRVSSSMAGGKAALATMSQLQILAVSALGMSPLVLQPLLRLDGWARPPFNLIISNVPGPRKPMYFNGARLDGLYPLSIPLAGQALNITCTSYEDNIAFGLTGCRRAVPHLQHLLSHLGDELDRLESALGRRPRATGRQR